MRGSIRLRVAAAGLALLLPWAATDASGEAMVPPRRLLEVMDFGPPILSPDGRQIAFRTVRASVERNAWDTTWFVQDVDGMHPRRVSEGGVPLRNSAGALLPTSAAWARDGTRIFFLASFDGRTDVWQANVDGSGSGPLTRDEADVEEFTLGEDGRELLYRVGPSRARVEEAEQAEYDRGIQVGPGTPVGQNLFRALDIGGRWATQRYRGAAFAFAPLLADSPRRWKAVDLGSLQVRERPRGSVPPPASQEAGGVADGRPEPWRQAAEPGGRRIAVLTRTGSAEGLLQPPGVQLSMWPDRSGRQAMSCTVDACSGKAIHRVQWRPGTDEVLFTVTDALQGRAQSIFRWNVRSGEVQSVVASRGLLNAGGADPGSPCAVARSFLVCVASEADRPPRLERIDLDTGTRHVLFDPNASLAADMAQAAPARLLRWTDGEGNAFAGHFFEARGAGAAPAPLFVTYYQCDGFLRGGTGDEWPLASLATHGISALCIQDPPGYLLDAVKRYDRGLSAVRSVVDLLAAEGTIERSKVGMGGLSLGSEVTLWTVMYSDLLAAASVASPALEPNYFLFQSLRDEALFDNVRRNWGVGPPGETEARWKVLSPIHHLDRIREPILFQMAEQEYLLALGTALPLVRRSQADLYVFPHETHVKFQPRHKLAVYERNLDWFRFWLLGEEDADPAKADQYTHWRGMRTARAER